MDRRKAAVTALTLAPLLVVPAGWVLLLEFDGQFNPRATLIAKVLLVPLLALPWLLALAASGLMRARWLGAFTVVLVAGVLLAGQIRTAELATWREQLAADSARHLREGGIPVALFHGSTLDLPLPGWALAQVNVSAGRTPTAVWYSRSGAPVSLEWQGAGPVQIYGGDCEWRSDASAAPTPPGPDRSCEPAGRVPRGQVFGHRSSSREFTQMWVEVPGGRWLLASHHDGLTPAQFLAVLSALEPVTVEVFAQRETQFREPLYRSNE